MRNRVDLGFQAFGAPESVDLENMVLFGTQVIKRGELRDGRFEIDKTAMEQIVSLGNAQPRGVKARFGHPNMCNPGLGTFLGRRTNFRIEGDYVKSDLHMSKAADPDMARHVIEMSQREPDMLGNSVVIRVETLEQQDENGKPKMREDGTPALPLARVHELIAVDVVDEPAAGDGMFSAPIDGVKFSPSTYIEIQHALEKPGFKDRILKFLGWADKFDSEPENEGEDASEDSLNHEEPAMTLEELKAKHPEAFAEHRKEIEESLSEKPKEAAELERARSVKILSRCKDEHFAKTKEHPDGFALSAIRDGLGIEDALTAMWDLSSRKNTLEILKQDTKDSHLDSATPPQEGADKEQQARKALADAREKRLGKATAN